jgi:WD40 repeat protein
MGVVYQARQTVMDRPVVIKVINQSLIDNPDALERFRRETRAAARLAHPNIVTAYDAEQAGGLHMLVMEFVPGRSLAEVLHQKGPLPVAQACDYARQAALGLQHAFEHGMVHRDVKPQNLMLTPQGQVKILDFGLAKVVSERGVRTGLTASGAYVGTPEYSAPEQAQDARQADIRADLYSLGCTLYCLLTGRPPFREETAVQVILAHREKEPPPLAGLRPDVPAGLWAVVARLLAKDPARRYQTPNEVARALAPFCTGEGKAATPLPPTEAASRGPFPAKTVPAAAPAPSNRRWRARMAVLLVVALGLTAVLGAGLLTWVGDRAPREVLQLKGHASAVTALAVSADGKRLLSGGADGSVRLWDVEQARELFLLKPGGGEKVRSVAFSPDGRVAAAAALRTFAWDSATGGVLHNGFPASVNGLAFSSDGRLLLTANNPSGWVNALWVAEKDLAPGGWETKRGPIRCLAGVPGDSCLLYVLQGDSAVYRIDVGGFAGVPKERWKVLNPEKNIIYICKLPFKEGNKVWRSGVGAITLLAAAPNGQEFATAADTVVEVWRLDPPRFERSLPHPGRVTALAYAPDSSALLTGCEDKRVRLWDAKTGRELRSFPGDPVAVHAVAYDGRRAFVAGEDKVVRVWELAKPGATTAKGK